MVRKIVRDAETHQKERNQSSLATRFFKIMHGTDCSEIMYLPPKFARPRKELAGEKTQIEDVNGKKWTVKISLVDGSLAFQEGWHKFFIDHQLEYGKVLLFNYTRRCYFIVRVYGLSACEILNFNRRSNRPNKKLRIDHKVVSQDEPCQTVTAKSLEPCQTVTSKSLEPCQVVTAVSMNEPKSSPSVSSEQEFKDVPDHPTTTNVLHSVNNVGNLPFSTKNMDDPSCMINRDSECYQKERSILFDLSRFEKGGNSFDAYRCETFLDRTIAPVNTQLQGLIKAKRNDSKIYMACENPSEIPCKRNSTKDMPNNAPELQTGNNRFIPADSESPFVASSKLAEKDDFLELKHRYSPVSSSILKYSLGKLNAVTKKELVELEVEDYGFPRLPCGSTSWRKSMHSQIPSSIVKTERFCNDSSTVKTEPTSSSDFIEVDSVSPFSAEVKNQSFLELPSSFTLMPGRRQRGRGKVIFLRDSTERLWPVFFPDAPFVKAFTDGWQTFFEGNSVKIGDECRFEVVSCIPCIYKVDVIHRAG